MTVKKAIKLTEWLLENNARIRKGLLDPQMPWNEEDDFFKKMARLLVAVYERDSKVLAAIRKELAGKCRHPKRMHDVCGGQKYCMNCNMDL